MTNIDLYFSKQLSLCNFYHGFISRILHTSCQYFSSKTFCNTFGINRILLVVLFVYRKLPRYIFPFVKSTSLLYSFVKAPFVRFARSQHLCLSLCPPVEIFFTPFPLHIDSFSLSFNFLSSTVLTRRFCFINLQNFKNPCITLLTRSYKSSWIQIQNTNFKFDESFVNICLIARSSFPFRVRKFCLLVLHVCKIFYAKSFYKVSLYFFSFFIFIL